MQLFYIFIIFPRLKNDFILSSNLIFFLLFMVQGYAKKRINYVGSINAHYMREMFKVYQTTY